MWLTHVETQGVLLGSRVFHPVRVAGMEEAGCDDVTWLP